MDVLGPVDDLSGGERPDAGVESGVDRLDNDVGYWQSSLARPCRRYGRRRPGRGFRVRDPIALPWISLMHGARLPFLFRTRMKMTIGPVGLTRTNVKHSLKSLNSWSLYKLKSHPSLSVRDQVNLDRFSGSPCSTLMVLRGPRRSARLPKWQTGSLGAEAEVFPHGRLEDESGESWSTPNCQGTTAHGYRWSSSIREIRDIMRSPR